MIIKYILVWFLLAIVAVANGIVRQGTYGKTLGDLLAHQISTVTAIIATGAIVWGANRIWPLPSASFAITVGFLWLLFTIAFEFGFGHYIAGHTWQRLFSDYNILKGRVWSLFLVWIAVLPFIVFKLTA